MRLNPRSVVSCQLSVVSWSGQSLIEVIVATAIVVGLAISLVTASLVTQRASRSAKNNTQATKLVQQNIEQMRIYRDRKGYQALSPGCFTLDTSSPDPANWSLTVLPTCSGSTVGEPVTLESTQFRRKIAISSASDTVRSITVTVSWSDSGGDQAVSNQTFLTTWCPGAVVPGSPCPTP
jgi:type II secretory pathway pseudopilin PulG